MSTFAEEKARGLDEAYRKAAQDVIADLQNVLAEPELDIRPVELERFEKVDRAWFGRATETLKSLGFRHLRDMDASALGPKGAPPMCVRVLLSEDGSTSAALYQVIPRSPGLLLKAILWMMRKWQTPRIVELISYGKDGRVVSTSNQGDVNQFSSPPNSSRRQLPLTASIEEVHAAHQVHLSETNLAPRRFVDFDQLNAAREAQRAHQNAWRLEVGLMPEELDRLLAPHGANGERIRPYIEKGLAERRS